MLIVDRVEVPAIYFEVEGFGTCNDVTLKEVVEGFGAIGCVVWEFSSVGI